MKDAGKYTDPRQAADLVEPTGRGTLAVAAGNARSVYIERISRPRERLRSLNPNHISP